MSRYAVLSDIHGNIRALEAVLAHAAARGLDRFLDLGDSVYGPLEPQATADRLQALRLAGVRGNEDRALVEPRARTAHASLEYVVGALAPVDRERLAARPRTAPIPPRDGGLPRRGGVP